MAEGEGRSLSVPNNVPDHRTELEDVAENEIKWCSPVSIQSVCLRWPHMTASDLTDRSIL